MANELLQPSTLAATRSRVRPRPQLGGVLALGTLVLLAVIFIFPLLWMLTTSFKQPGDELVWPPQWIPSPATLDNYTSLFSSSTAQYFPFPTFIFNSAYIAVVVVIGRLLVCAMGGYAFARMNFPGRDLAFGMLLAALLLPDVVMIIPLYSLYFQIGWLDTHLPLLVPPIFANTFGTFLFRQFFLTLPQELDDAARIDGASALQIYLRIYVPLMAPALAAVGTYALLFAWNDYFYQYMLLTSEKHETVAMALEQFFDDDDAPWNVMMATAILYALPPIAIFYALRRYMAAGLSMGGVKG